MNFQENRKKELGHYREQLGIPMGFFIYRGKCLPKEHILPKEYTRFNIISQYRDEFWKCPSSDISFHRYFHHLNSSQALCINLFFPLQLEDQIDLILKLLGILKIDVSTSCFEKESDMEITAGRKTNFDFYIQLSNKSKVYFEIKYTEREFGKSRNDYHKEKFCKTYQPLLENNLFIKEEYKRLHVFLKHYQIMRNLVHITDNNFVVFVYPKSNKKIHEEAQIVCKNILTDEGKEKFRILFLEETVNDIIREVQSRKLRDHYKEFKIKYLK